MSKTDELFSHPCKETCSGWKQGYEAGLTQSWNENETLRGLLERANKLLNQYYNAEASDLDNQDWLSDYAAMKEGKE